MITKIEIIVAVDEAGNVDCVPYMPYNIQAKNRSDNFLSLKNADARKWQISYLRAYVPVPCDPIIQAEVMAEK